MVDLSQRDQFKSFGPAERQGWISDYILEQGSVTVDELADLFSVSRMTIHRDLDDLERMGVLRKVRNGATAQPSNQFESDVRYRLKYQLAEKTSIARAALAHIEPGQTLFLDEATTLVPLIPMLTSVAPLTVITNFMPIIKALTAVKEIRLFSLGGEYLAKYDTFTGLLCERTVETLRADVYLTSVPAIANGVLFHPEERIVKVKRAMISNSARRIMLIDHTKFSKLAMHQVASVQEFDLIIVDSATEPAHVANLRALGARVEVAA